MGIENFADLRGHIRKNAEHKVLHGNIFIPHALCGLFRRTDYEIRLRSEIHFSAGDLRQGGDVGIKLRQKIVAVRSHFAEDGGDKPAVLINKGIKKMFGNKSLVFVFPGNVLCVLYCFKGFLSEVLGIHKITCFVMCLMKFIL